MGSELIPKDLNEMKKVSRDDLVKRMKTVEQAETPSYHHFTDGLYTRETHMPAGSIVVGKKHRYRVTNIMVKGHVSIINGDEVAEYKAPCIFESEAGVSKVAYFHEDSVWLNCHPTEETDLEKIEEEVIKEEPKCLG